MFLLFGETITRNTQPIIMVIMLGSFLHPVRLPAQSDSTSLSPLRPQTGKPATAVSAVALLSNPRHQVEEHRECEWFCSYLALKPGINNYEHTSLLFPLTFSLKPKPMNNSPRAERFPRSVVCWLARGNLGSRHATSGCFVLGCQPFNPRRVTCRPIHNAHPRLEWARRTCTSSCPARATYVSVSRNVTWRGGRPHPPPDGG